MNNFIIAMVGAHTFPFRVITSGNIGQASLLVSLWRTPLLIFAVLGFAACSSQGQGVYRSPGISGEGSFSFREMGWSDDMLGTADSAPATVRFWLPEDAKQGEPYLHGVRLEYEWQGNPGDVGDFAYLRGRWNDLGFYLLAIERLTTLDEGFHWSLADLVNGYSEGYELGAAFRAASTNFAQIRAVQPGWNEVSISLDLLDASNKDIQVLVQKGIGDNRHIVAASLY